jgi:hypothetical protein
MKALGSVLMSSPALAPTASSALRFVATKSRDVQQTADMPADIPLIEVRLAP